MQGNEVNNACEMWPNGPAPGDVIGGKSTFSSGKCQHRGF